MDKKILRTETNSRYYCAATANASGRSGKTLFGMVVRCLGHLRTAPKQRWLPGRGGLLVCHAWPNGHHHPISGGG